MPTYTSTGTGAGDYNGDGRNDLLVRQYSSGMLGTATAAATLRRGSSSDEAST